MAKCQYNGDSPFPSPISAHSGMTGSPETVPVKTASFPAMPAKSSSVPASYALSGGAAWYTGESVDYARLLRDHGAADTTPHPARVSPSTASTIN